MGFYIIQKKKKMSKFLMQNIIVVYCACQKNEKISRLGGKSDEFVKKRSCQNMCYCVNEL